MKLYIASLALVAATLASSVEAGGIHEKIVNEERLVVFNSRRLTGECLPVCVEKTELPQILETANPTVAPTANPTIAPTANPTVAPTANPTVAPTANPTKAPTPSPTDVEILEELCPGDVPKAAVCKVDTDCLVNDGIAALLNCPSCVKGQCVEKPSVNGNLNCCKRTPGNDLVITNGCGANNICFGFNDHDQCEVNQHAAYCHPNCWNGNTNPVTGELDFSVCTDRNGNPTNIDNDQGSKDVTKIYPMTHCLTRDIKFKNGITGEMDLDSLELFTNANALPAPELPQVSNEAFCPDPNNPPSECKKDSDCIDHPDHSPMFCPSCENGMCVARPEVKGNLNCCKRTPGNDLVVTNGCGANNICWGFDPDDQCEVNQFAVYCHPGCPDGNVNDDGSVNANCDSMLKDDQGSKGESPGGLPKIYPLSVCSCDDVKFKASGAFSEFSDACFAAGASGATYEEVPPPEPLPAAIPGFCSTGKLSFQCGKDVLTCGMGGSSNICSHQHTSGGGKVVEIDSTPAFTSDYGSLCEEIETMIQNDFDDAAFGAIKDIKCGEVKVQGKWQSLYVEDFACYGDSNVWWEWKEGQHIGGALAC